MTNQARRYKTPESARKAVTDKLRQLATRLPWRLSDLQRQYAYDQLVERLYRLDEHWVIKGGTVLIARKVSMRHTIDIDVYRPGSIADAERILREASALDIGDWMRFEVGTTATLRAAGAEAAQVGMKAFIGTRLWAAFQVDIVADGILMTGQPDAVPPLTGIEMGDRERVQWRAYPLIDHVADKVCAIIERHDGMPSTRFKDLIDLVAIAQRTSPSADLQMQALTAEARRRGLELPGSFKVPDRELWDRGYKAEARRAVGLSALDLHAALAITQPFLNPLLSGSAAGAWSPNSQRWVPQRAALH